MSILEEPAGNEPPQGAPPQAPSPQEAAQPPAGTQAPWWQQHNVGPDSPWRRYASAEEAEKAMRHAQVKISQKGLDRPPPGAPPEVVAAYNRARGWPETAEAYQLALPEDLREAVSIDELPEDVGEKLRGYLHEAGVPEDLAAGVAAIPFRLLRDAMEEKAKEDAQYDVQMEAELRQEWSKNYDTNIQAARAYAKNSGLLNVIEQEGLEVTPGLVRWLAAQGKASADPLPERGSRPANVSLKSALDAHMERRPDPERQPLEYDRWHTERVRLLADARGRR